MKKIAFLALLQASVLSFAQNDLNGNWYLKKMQINKVDHYPETLDAIAQISYSISDNSLTNEICIQNSYSTNTRYSLLTTTSTTYPAPYPTLLLLNSSPL